MSAKYRQKNWVKSHIHNATPLVVILTFIVVGVVLVLLAKAGVPTAAFETESSTNTRTAVIANDSLASDRAYTRFGKPIAFGKASPGGTYADWLFSSSGLASIEWSVVSVQDPPASLASQGLLHYYAYTFGVKNQNANVGYGYAGFQTNGLINGQFRGKVVNFSFWRSNGGNSPAPGIINSANQESSGFQIMYPFNWVVGRTYAFELKQGPSGIDGLGKWWGLWVTDRTTGAVTYMGEQRVPTIIDGKDSSLLEPHTGAFGEDLHWWRSLSGGTKYACQDFDKSSMIITKVSANGGATKPTSFSAYTNSLNPSKDPNNGYETINCPVSVYTNANNSVQMNLGFWSPGAPALPAGL